MSCKYLRANLNLIPFCIFFSVETSDGQFKQEQGQVVNPGRQDESIAVRGQFSYIGPDGVTYAVAYLADDSGFHPQGAHLPRIRQ